MKNITAVFALIGLLFLSTYCANQVDSSEVQTDAPYFPRRIATPGEEAQMEALLTGELIFQANCFRIKSEDDQTFFTPIWPPGFDYQLTADSVFIILNTAGNEVARTGVGIRLSGGAVNNAQALEGQIEGGIPKLLLSCPVPYWVVGNEVQAVDVESELSAAVKIKLNNWFDFYAPHIEDWRLEAFDLSDKWQIDSLFQIPADNIYPLAERPDDWLIYDPDGRRNLDLYARDIMVERKNGGESVAYALSPDSEVALEHPDQGFRQRLLFCGTPCRFEDAFWEDDETVMIAGLHQGPEQSYHPTLWRINLHTLTVREYTYPTPLPDPFPHSYVREKVFGDK